MRAFIHRILLLLVAATGSAAESDNSPPDIIFIVPDRSTPYPNGLHNGILTSSYDYEDEYTVEVREYGNYVQSRSFALLNDAIDTPSAQQPKVYCIWPMDVESKTLVGELYEKHGVPIVQINQLPDDWEMDHLLGYAGPEDAGESFLFCDLCGKCGSLIRTRKDDWHLLNLYDIKKHLGSLVA